MFCRFCGKALETGVTECPSCGNKQEQLMNGNGFWDLCASGPARSVPYGGQQAYEDETDAPEVEETEDEELMQPEQEPKRGNKLPVIILAVLLMGCICLSIFLGVRLSQTSAELERVSEQASQLKRELQELEDNIEEEHASQEETTGIQEEPVTTTQAQETETDTENVIETTEEITEAEEPVEEPVIEETLSPADEELRDPSGNDEPGVFSW